MQSSPFRARLPLPNNPITSETVCYSVELPNDPRILEAFEGAVLSLGRWTVWEHDLSHTGRLAAKVFLRLYDRLRSYNCKRNNAVGQELEDCMQLRISPDNPCIIQCLDCNNNWTDWYDPTGCIPGIVSQPSGGGVVTPGTCREYDVVLQGNSQWRLPVAIQVGDTVTITGATGGWADGSGLWFCPDGSSYALGGCSSVPAIGSGDPCPLIPHARLIAIEDSGPLCHDAASGMFTIVSSSPANLDFQMNDPSLGDNGGSISFHVKYCRADSSTWCLDIGLLTGDGGFFPNPSVNDPSGHWVSGSGWLYTDQIVTGSSDHSRAVRIRKNLGGTFHVTRIDMTYNLTRGTHVPDGDQATGIGIAGHNVNFPTSNGTGLHNNGTGLSVDISTIDLTVYADYHVGGSAVDGSCAITHVHIEGSGAFPTGAVAC